VSRARDRLNAAAALKLLGRVPPPREVPQPLAVAAAGAGGGAAGGLASWSKTLALDGTTLSVGTAYYYNSGWTALAPTVDQRHAVALCIDAVSDPAASTLLLAGEFARSGTAGAVLYVDDDGTLTETFPGDQDDETMSGPWVWQVGWQVTSDLAIFIPPREPYRPRLVRYCLSDGVTQLDVVVTEIPADPA